MDRILVERFLKTTIGDHLVDRFQLNAERTFSSISRLPFLDSVIRTDVVLLSSIENAIEHHLGRQYAGYLVTRIIAGIGPGSVYPYILSSSTFDKTQFLPLSVDRDVTVDLLVY